MAVKEVTRSPLAKRVSDWLSFLVNNDLSLWQILKDAGLKPEGLPKEKFSELDAEKVILFLDKIIPNIARVLRKKPEWLEAELLSIKKDLDEKGADKQVD